MLHVSIQVATRPDIRQVACFHFSPKTISNDPIGPCKGVIRVTMPLATYSYTKQEAGVAYGGGLAVI
jgi:hypothetical protein